jgi:peptidoglycan hydrolase CwlO-like protein
LEIYITISIAFLSGFLLAWILRTISLNKERRLHVSSKGLLESERLIKETLRKESAMAFQLKETLEAEMKKRLKEAELQISSMDQDILLLQKSNEETEELLRKGQPELHQLKLKLIEANNTISRLKAKQM